MAILVKNIDFILQNEILLLSLSLPKDRYFSSVHINITRMWRVSFRGVTSYCGGLLAKIRKRLASFYITCNLLSDQCQKTLKALRRHKVLATHRQHPSTTAYRRRNSSKSSKARCINLCHLASSTAAPYPSYGSGAMRSRPAAAPHWPKSTSDCKRFKTFTKIDDSHEQRTDIHVLSQGDDMGEITGCCVASAIQTSTTDITMMYEQLTRVLRQDARRRQPGTAGRRHSSGNYPPVRGTVQRRAARVLALDRGRSPLRHGDLQARGMEHRHRRSCRCHHDDRRQPIIEAAGSRRRTQATASEYSVC